MQSNSPCTDRCIYPSKPFSTNAKYLCFISAGSLKIPKTPFTTGSKSVQSPYSRGQINHTIFKIWNLLFTLHLCVQFQDDSSPLAKLPVFRFFTGFSKNYRSILLKIRNLLFTLHLCVQFHYNSSTKLPVFRYFTGFSKNYRKIRLRIRKVRRRLHTYVYPEIFIKIGPFFDFVEILQKFYYGTTYCRHENFFLHID